MVCDAVVWIKSAKAYSSVGTNRKYREVCSQGGGGIWIPFRELRRCLRWPYRSNGVVAASKIDWIEMGVPR